MLNTEIGPDAALVLLDEIDEIARDFGTLHNEVIDEMDDAALELFGVCQAAVCP